MISLLVCAGNTLIQKLEKLGVHTSRIAPRDAQLGSRSGRNLRNGWRLLVRRESKPKYTKMHQNTSARTPTNPQNPQIPD